MLAGLYIKNIFKALWKVMIVFVVLTISACSSMDDKRRSEAGSTIPWNRPAPWEDNPGITSPIRW
ncbi:MAG: hypothetical protein DRI44_01530 [Chlamydiae bacterium]|nr:MAG: hypothetical protein DRI44_01530 [Chlamydiota bacterium]